MDVRKGREPNKFTKTLLKLIKLRE